MDEIAISLKNINLYLPSRRIAQRSGRYRIFYDMFRMGDYKKNKLGDELILSDINLTIYKGDKVGLIGTNGSGKTSLLRLISKIIPPSSGQLKTPTNILPMLSVGTFLSSMDSAFNNLLILCCIYSVPLSKREKLIHDVLNFSELLHLRDKPVCQFSHGMQSRLLIVFYYFLNADVYLIDEIIGAGDEKFNHKFNELLKDKLQSSSTFIVASHNIHILKTFCSRGIVLKHGIKSFDGNIDDAIDFYRNNEQE